MDVTQQKLAEKLTILTDRGVGLLTRLYNIKKVGSGLDMEPKGEGPIGELSTAHTHQFQYFINA